MFYEIKNNKIIKNKELASGEENPCLAVFPFEKMLHLADKYHLDYAVLEENASFRTAKLETFEGFDIICLTMLHYDNLLIRQKRLLLYLKKDAVFLFAEDTAHINSLLQTCMLALGENISLGRFLCRFFLKALTSDSKIFDSMEREILSLEQALITSKKRDCVREIISLRKRLMFLKRYYEQLLNILDDLQDNENNSLDKKTLRYFRSLQARINRLYQNVLNLREYVTQVREAYEAEVDISLNETMKFFTVITSIFLPLTLLVGWYGMNLEMPEYEWSYGYLCVILSSIFITGGMLYYFKKNKWF